MKKKDWFRSFSYVNDKYVEESNPSNVTAKKNSSRLLTVLVATCASLAIIACNLWLFIPFRTTPPDVSKYKNSEYYEVIQNLNVATFTPPRYKNNAQKLWGILKTNLSFGCAKGGDVDLMPPAMNGVANDAGNYQEITDNQVAGIIEADRIKRSDTHIYYLDADVLRVYAINKENTVEVGNYTLYAGSNNYYLNQWEFYLSSDCKTVTVITQYYEKKNINSNRFVSLVSLDVSDPTNIVKKDEFKITGDYMSSRTANGSILLLTEFVINKNGLDFDDESTFIPQIDEGEGLYSLPASSILSPEDLNDPRYTIAMKLDESTLDLVGTAAYLSYSEEVYVSENHLFLTHVFAEKTENDDGTITRNAMTEISCLSYGEEQFEIKGKATVRGYVKDQWSMDEYEGVLRVFTTTNATRLSSPSSNNANVSVSVLQTATGRCNASLYCIDLNSFEIIASVIDFAPPYEEIQSVRFDGEIAYACTSIERSDPVFFFDLSDLSNITYKDTGTIEGFSTSLINLGNGYLLGLGVGASWNSFKVEVYEEIESGVRSVCSYELEYAEYSTEYKSYYIDRQNQLIGVGVSDYSADDYERYLLLHFDGYELVELINTKLNGTPEYKRGVYIDGYMYMFGVNDFKVEKVFD